MKLRFIALAVVIAGLSASVTSTEVIAQQRPNVVEVLRAINGRARVIGSDGNGGTVQLGLVSSNQLDSNSICNPVSRYGSDVSSTSIWNNVGRFGNEFSNTSAYNARATEPPLIVMDGSSVYISKNPRLLRIDPDVVKSVLCDN
jgi:hypothetical protein